MTQEATFHLQLADSSYIECFLKSLVNQDFDKTKTHLYVTSDAESLSDSRILREFIEAAKPQYRNVVIDESLGAQARQRSVAYAIDNRTSYVSIDQNMILHPQAVTGCQVSISKQLRRCLIRGACTATSMRM